MDAQLKEQFDVIFLFDVLEHITEEDRFLRALAFYLAPGGKLVINVPAAVGLFVLRCGSRPRAALLDPDVARECGAESVQGRRWTYWGCRSYRL